jgi:hypothetical protein
LAVPSPGATICRACLQEKGASEFYSRLNRHGNPWTDTTCKACRITKVTATQSRPERTDAAREWRKRHKQKLRREAGARLREEIAMQAIQRDAERAAARAERQAERQMRRNEPLAHVRRMRAVLSARAYQRVKSSTPKGLIDNRMRTSVRKALQGGKRGRAWELLVGYSLDDLMTRLERQFTEGMSWANVGEWHIDHIRPRSSFNYSSPDDPEFKQCWSLENLQPLWARDNLVKGDRWHPPGELGSLCSAPLHG